MNPVRPQPVRLLHVEDDPGQRLLTAHLLATVPEYDFSITPAESEADAIIEFRREPAGFVLLDYQLTEGNGLSCLKKLRRLDPLVPIVAISGVATPEIAAELLHAGADDYLTKEDLTDERLARTVRASLALVEGCRRQGNDTDRRLTWGPDVEAAFRRLCQRFSGLGAELLVEFAACERAARDERLSPEHVQRLFDTVCVDYPADTGPLVLRPLLLELLVRLDAEDPGSRG